MVQTSKVGMPTSSFPQQKYLEQNLKNPKQIECLHYLKNPLTHLLAKLCTSAYCFENDVNTITFNSEVCAIVHSILLFNLFSLLVMRCLDKTSS